MAKIGRNTMAIAHAKYSLWVKKENCLWPKVKKKEKVKWKKEKVKKKKAKYVCTNTLELFHGKNGFKKQLILEKWEHFENSQKWTQCKDYSPCKILTFAQKLKMQKRREKRFHDHIGFVVCTKRQRKAASIRKMRAFRNWPKIATMQRL